MAYTVTITEVAANVAVNESSYPVTVSYDAVQLDGVNISSAEVNGVGNLILTLSDTTTIDAGLVVGADGADGADGAPGTNGTDGADGADGADGISITSATVNGVGNLVITLSDASTIDTGHVVGADGAAGADGAPGADGADGVSVTDADVVSGNLVLTLSDASTVDAGPLPTGTISYTITDGTNTQTISDGDTITVNGTTNEIDVAVSATDTVTVSLVDNPIIGGNLTVTGNLTVNGTTTTINSTTLDVDDLNITVAKGAADATAANGAGLTVDGAGATLTYNSTGNVWAFDRDLTVSGGTITATKISNWDTAYGWGDHSTEGYLTSYTETDPVFSASAASGIVAGNITNWNTAYNWGDHSTQGYLTSYTETDPVFTASAASGILAGNITNWNTAYSWGDHSTQGYLTSFTETNDLTSAVTWATVPDAYISTSSVEQHEGNLAIAFSQLTATPTTLSGYGITDGYTDSDVDTHLNTSGATTNQVLSWSGSDYAWVAQSEGTTSNSFETISVNGTNVVADSSTDTLTLVAGTNVTLTGNAVTDTITISSEQTEVANSNRVIYTCVNKSGGALDKGTPVYAKDVAISGQTIAVDAADASDPAKMPAIGVLNEDLANDAEGDLLINGQIQGIDTQTPGFGRGDVIWVASGGGYTNTKPTGEGVLLQNLGTVTKVDTTNGGGIVMGAGRSAATPNLNEGNIFLGNVGNAAVSTSLDTAVGDAGYIKTYTETNDLTSAVTWATVPDAYISSTSVTQHQASLQITESQITDLAHTTSLPFASITSTPTTVAGYGITDALSSTLAGNIDMNGYYLVDSSQTGTPTLALSKSYTDPATSTTSYVAQINGGDLHIDQDKSTPNLVYMTNPNTGTTATTEFRMAGGAVTGSSTYNFGFMSMAGSGYAHPYLSNIDPGELFFSNFNGDVVIGTGTGLGTNGSHRCKFKVKSALGSSVFFGATGLPDFDALVVDENGDTTLGATLKLTDFEEKINTGLATSGTLTPDPADGTVQTATLTGDITINGLSNASAGQTVTLILTQPSSGNYTLTSSMLFAGGDKTLSTASNAVDIISIFYDGSTYYASLAKGFA